MPVVAAVPTPAQLPPDVEGFTGRDTELALLDSAPSGVVVVSGPPGAGKTALAVHWAHRAAARFPDGQLHVDLHGFGGTTGPRDPADAVRLMLDAFGLEPHRIPADRDAQVALYRSLTSQRRLLVILDNARDAEQVRPLLPAGGGVRTVVTSRRRLTAVVAGLGAQPLELDVLAEPAATELFRRRLGPREADPVHTADIVEACGRLPLALALAAARARLTGSPLATLAAELRRPVGRLEALDDGERGVRAVFSWSYEGLSSSAARLFRLLGLVVGPDIAIAPVVALAGRTGPEVRRTLRELADVGLVAERASGRYAMHDLLRAYAGELARATESTHERRAAMTRLLDHYTHTAYHADLVLNPARAPIPLPLDPAADGARPEPLDDLKVALSWLRSEREALLAAVRQAKDEGLDAQAWQLSWALDTFLHEQGRWDDEGAAWAVATEAAAALTDGPALAYAYSFRAVADGRRQRFEPAQVHMRQALDLVRAAGDRAGEGECLFILSYLCWLQGAQDAALARAEQSLALFRQVDEPMWAGKASLAVGWYLTQRGEHRQALPYYTEALALQQRAGDHPNEAVTRDGLGWLQHQLEDYDDAVRHLQEGLRLARRLGDPSLEAQVLGHLGDVHEALMDRDTAAARWRQAYEILADLGHPQAAELRRKLAIASPPSGDGPDSSEEVPAARGFGVLVRDHRLRGGMSQEDLAARTGLSVRTIRYLESGRTGRPRPETMRLLCDAFGLDSADRERLHAAAFTDRRPAR
ncbi:MAG TPA: tetratricopeptide repeat protein [Actinoplanes sp.]|nr:tetratricopeptide repeat protein [Actinoplanes sp.]